MKIEPTMPKTMTYVKFGCEDPSSNRARERRLSVLKKIELLV